MEHDLDDATSFWDAHYARHPDVWHGTPNAVLVAETGDLTPGSALDVGCGEGGDAIWLAGRSWRVTGVDVSSIALARAARHARAAGVGDRITWARHDAERTFPSGSYDLVTAHYLHSPRLEQRRRLLERMVGAVGAGGTLLLVGHASTAPWSWDQEARLPSARDVLDGLALAPATWTVAVCEDRPRHAVGPDGQAAVVLDSIVRAVRAP